MGAITYIPQGRLGNALFQMAACIGYANKHGFTFTPPHRTNNPVWNPIFFPELRKEIPKLPTVRIVEDDPCYEELPYQDSWKNKNIILQGYFQSYKYFDIEEVRQVFNLPIKTDKGLVGVHIRRGDYLNLKHKHVVHTVESVRAHMEVFPGYSFKFFSDDIAWCRTNFPGHDYSKEKNPLTDLIYFASCEHQICSPSTFSVWGGYLNPNPDKIVTMTKDYYVPGHPGSECNDLIPEKWLRI